jgi:hypothetical protein
VVAIIGWIKFIFTTEQKKTDYKPEEDAPMQMISPVRTTLKITFSVFCCIVDNTKVMCQPFNQNEAELVECMKLSKALLLFVLPYQSFFFFFKFHVTVPGMQQSCEGSEFTHQVHTTKPGRPECGNRPDGAGETFPSTGLRARP